jgi:hypothetical protein
MCAIKDNYNYVYGVVTQADIKRQNGDKNSEILQNYTLT